VYRFWVWKPEGKRPLRRPRCKWEDNIKIDLQEVKSNLKYFSDSKFNWDTLKRH
jgi:hypothetical protein